VLAIQGGGYVVADLARPVVLRAEPTTVAALADGRSRPVIKVREGSL
jgi:hypothetical protein